MAPPPLQTRLNNNSAIDHARTTTVLEIAKQTCHSHRRINLYLIAPWCQTSASFGDRVNINACKPETRDDKEKQKLIDDHKERVRDLAQQNDCLVVYSDGSMVKKGGFPQVGAAVVGIHKGEEVFHKKMGMGAELRCMRQKWWA